jgi:hypothetical protein
VSYLGFYTSTGRLLEGGWLAGKAQAQPAGPCTSSYTYTLAYLEGWTGEPDWVSCALRLPPPFQLSHDANCSTTRSRACF